MFEKLYDKMNDIRRPWARACIVQSFRNGRTEHLVVSLDSVDRYHDSKIGSGGSNEGCLIRYSLHCDDKSSA